MDPPGGWSGVHTPPKLFWRGGANPTPPKIFKLQMDIYTNILIKYLSTAILIHYFGRKCKKILRLRRSTLIFLIFVILRVTKPCSPSLRQQFLHLLGQIVTTHLSSLHLLCFLFLFQSTHFPPFLIFSFISP